MCLFRKLFSSKKQVKHSKTKASKPDQKDIFAQKHGRPSYLDSDPRLKMIIDDEMRQFLGYR